MYLTYTEHFYKILFYILKRVLKYLDPKKQQPFFVENQLKKKTSSPAERVGPFELVFIEGSPV